MNGQTTCSTSMEFNVASLVSFVDIGQLREDEMRMWDWYG